MIRLALRFPAGRFHATPWDHHVNEGVPEWPPSPWRILRALYATLCERCVELDRELALRAIRKLSGPPRFTLPPASSGHSRHYLSLNQLERQKTAMTFDTFMAISRDQPIEVVWDAELEPAEVRALGTLASQLSYLGRAESWCDAALLAGGPAADGAPCEVSDGVARPGWVTVRVLCPAEGFSEDDLRRSTDELQREGWSDPPGTRWVLYRRRRTETATARPASSRPADRHVAEFALGGAVLPRVDDSVRVAEAFRRAVLSLHGDPSRTLAGKEVDGAPLREGHQHAHYVPEARGSDPRRISHMVVYAPCGFTDQEEQALAQIRFLPRDLIEEPYAHRRAREAGDVQHRGIAAQVSRAAQRRETMDLDVVLCGFAARTDLQEGAARQAQGSGDPLASVLFARSRTWRSRTPFVLPRHPRRGRDGAEDQLRRELALRGLPHDPAGLEITPEAAPPWGGFWNQFRTSRLRDDHHTPAVGFSLRFKEAVQGPLLLGYGSHYGLGQFEPA